MAENGSVWYAQLIASRFFPFATGLRVRVYQPFCSSELRETRIPRESKLRSRPFALLLLVIFRTVVRIRASLPGKRRGIEKVARPGRRKVSAAVNRQTRKGEILRPGNGRKSRSGEKQEVGEKKNRKSVGKRNYRSMHRSFRHVGFERESAIGRCFFPEVIRVFVRSLAFAPPSRFSARPTPRCTFRGAEHLAMIYSTGNLYCRAEPPPTDLVEIR